jgi:hypothetical protein
MKAAMSEGDRSGSDDFAPRARACANGKPNVAKAQSKAAATGAARASVMRMMSCQCFGS